MFRLFVPILLAVNGLALSHAVAADCDFKKVVGTCKGSITVDSTKGSKPNYSAEITVRSSAPTCSKVEYFIDNTPHQTVLKGGNADRESTFGSSPISKKSFEISRCTAYLDKDNGGQKDTGKSAAVGPQFFEGRWRGRVSMLVFSDSIELTINVNGTRASGRSVATKDSIEFSDGSISGGRMTYSFHEPINGDTVNVTLTRVSDNTIRYSGGFSGTLTRQ
jgi:hypothetical protein